MASIVQEIQTGYLASESKVAESAPLGHTLTLSGSAASRRLRFDASTTVTVSASLRAIEYEPANRPVLDLIPVLDRSGSMSGRKMHLLKEAMGFVIKELRNDDRLGLVSFGTDVTLDSSLQKMDSTGRKAAEDICNAMIASSMTNLSGGVLRGIEELRSTGRAVPEGSDRAECRAILLMTDGRMNKGITCADRLADIVKKALHETPGSTSLFAFGLGADSDGDTLRSVTDAVGGSFYNLENADDLATAFGDCLGGLLSVVAQSCVLRVEAQGGAKLESVMTKFATRTLAEGVVEITLPDIYSGETKDVLMKLTVPQLGTPVEGFDAPLVRMSLRYADAIRGEITEIETDLFVSRPTADVARADPLVNVGVMAQSNRVLVADALDAAKKKADGGSLADAQKILDEAGAAVLGSFPGAEECTTCTGLLGDLERSKTSMETQAEWRERGRWETSNAAQEHYYQRCSKANMVGQMRSAYRNVSKAKMVEKMMAHRSTASQGGSKAKW